MAVIAGMKCTDTHRLSSGKIIARLAAALKKTRLESARGDRRKLLGAVCQSGRGGCRRAPLKILSTADKLRVGARGV